MSLAVAWTGEAQETFDLTVSQIENEWGIRSAENFIKDTNRIIASISKQPFIFKASYSTNIRKAVVSKQTSMFYEVHAAHITI